MVLGTGPTSTSTTAGLPGEAVNTKGKKTQRIFLHSFGAFGVPFNAPWTRKQGLKFFLAPPGCPFVFQAAFESRPGNIWGENMGHSLQVWWYFNFCSLTQCASHCFLPEFSHICSIHLIQSLHCVQWGDRVECAYFLLPRAGTPRCACFTFVFTH